MKNIQEAYKAVIFFDQEKTLVMCPQVSSADNQEKEVRRKLIETGHTDVIISIFANFPHAQVWFFDKEKPGDLQDKVLMLDGQGIYQATRKVNDFSPEQLKNLTAITWLYWGQSEQYLSLIKEYLNVMATKASLVMESLSGFEICLEQYTLLLRQFAQVAVMDENKEAIFYQPYLSRVWELVDINRGYEKGRTLLLQEIVEWLADYDILPTDNEGQKQACTDFEPLADHCKWLHQQIEQMVRLAVDATEVAGKELDAEKNIAWDEPVMNSRRKELEELGYEMINQLQFIGYYYEQVIWLEIHFPDAKLVDVPGLVKIVGRTEFEK